VSNKTGERATVHPLKKRNEKVKSKGRRLGRKGKGKGTLKKEKETGLSPRNHMCVGNANESS